MTLSRKPEELWEAFFERTAHSLGIPNEMTNSERSEIFSGIPGSKAGYGSVTFILPNSFPDSKRVGIGNTNCFRCPSRPGEGNEKQANRPDAASVMLG